MHVWMYVCVHAPRLLITISLPLPGLADWSAFLEQVLPAMLSIFGVATLESSTRKLQCFQHLQLVFSKYQM